MPNAFTLLLLFGATPAHEPESPSEPWLKGVHLTQAEWGKTRSYLELWLRRKKKRELSLYLLGVMLAA